MNRKIGLTEFENFKSVQTCIFSEIVNRSPVSILLFGE